MTTTQTAPAAIDAKTGMKLHRFIGKCRACKTVNVRTDILGWTMATNCDGCKVRMNVKRINGNFGKKECGGVCMGAVGPSCDCKCGGENHGRNHAA